MSRHVRVVGWILLVLVLGAGWGAVLGVLWEWAWTPPTGAAWQGEWYLDPDGLRSEVSATGWFTVIGLLGGVVYGLVGAWLGRGRELAALALVVLGSLLAGWVMFHVGHLLGPPDPHELARTTGDLEPIPGDLSLAGAGDAPWPLWFESSAFNALPAGALVGVVAMFLGQRASRPGGGRGAAAGGAGSPGPTPDPHSVG